MVTLTPAYGRDYKNKKEVITDFESNKDFIFNSFNEQAYCTKEDLIKSDIKSVQIRYKKNTQIVVIKL